MARTTDLRECLLKTIHTATLRNPTSITAYIHVHIPRAIVINLNELRQYEDKITFAFYFLTLQKYIILRVGCAPINECRRKTCLFSRYLCKLEEKK